MRAPRRRFTVFDALVLVAATALGLAVARALDATWFTVLLRGGYQWDDYLHFVLHGVPSTCLVASWSVGLLALRLVHPRPSLRRIARQYGPVACAATVASIALAAACDVARHTADWSVIVGLEQVPELSLWDVWWPALMTTDEFVLGAWLGLALAVGRSPSHDWVDRAGRAIGLYWITWLAYAVVTQDFW